MKPVKRATIAVNFLLFMGATDVNSYRRYICKSYRPIRGDIGSARANLNCVIRVGFLQRKETLLLFTIVSACSSIVELGGCASFQESTFEPIHDGTGTWL